jgi:thermitase
MRRNQALPPVAIDTSAGPAVPRPSRGRLSAGAAIALAAVAAAVGLLILNGAAAPGATVQAAPPPQGPDTGEVLVKFKPGAAQQAIDALNAANGAVQVDEIAAIGVKVLKVGSAQAAAAIYARNPLVEFAEPNALVLPEAIPNDPSFSSEWHLSKIEAPAAWDSVKATGVMIAICDTGVASVPDLAPVLRGDLGWNAVDGSTNWGDPIGHGTWVSGSAAAATNNATGVAGVAWGAQILPVRVSNLSDGSASVSDAAKCINYGADKGARVINLSYRMAGYATIDSAGKYAQGKGGVTLVAAGNDGTNPGWTNYSGFLAVSATDSLDQIKSFSNYGAFVDLAAPGSSILTTKQDGTYLYAAGTSFSSPVAAGVFALVFAAKPSLSASQAQSIVLSNSDDLGAVGWDQYYGYGRVNARKAVQAALGASSSTATPTPTASAQSPIATATPALPSPTATATTAPLPLPDSTAPTAAITSPGNGQAVGGNARISVSASDNVGVTRVEVYIDGVLMRTLTSAPYTTQWNTRQSGNGAHTVTAKAYDAAGNNVSVSVTVTVAN